MVALLFILASIAVLAAVFAIVVRQMAKAHRQFYLEEVALNDLAFVSQPEPKAAAGKLRSRMRAAGPHRKQFAHALKGRLRTASIMR